MQEVTKRALKNALKNCETKVAQFNQRARQRAGFQWANQRAGFQWARQWAGFQWARQWAGFKWNGVVLLGAVLLSLLFVGNLQAQSLNDQSSVSTKQGFFAGIVYLQGFGVDTTKTSTSSAGYRITGNYSNYETGIDATGGNPFAQALTITGIRTLVEKNCEGSDISIDIAGDGEYYFRQNFDSFDSGAKNDATVTRSSPTISFLVGLLDTDTGLYPKSHCERYFYGDLSSDRETIIFSAYSVTADSPSASVTNTESDEIKGVGLQFGWRGEKWRASLTHFTGKGGANELVNTVVMAEYFFHEELFVGGGLASMKLTNGSTSASATSPVITVGYKENLTPNLFFNISLTKYISGISLSGSTPASAPITTGRTFSETQIEIGKKDSNKATIGVASVRVGRLGTGTGANQNGFRHRQGGSDNRIEATQFRSRDVEIQEVTIPATQKIEAEIKAPVVFSISLLWRF